MTAPFTGDRVIVVGATRTRFRADQALCADETLMRDEELDRLMTGPCCSRTTSLGPAARPITSYGGWAPGYQSGPDERTIWPSDGD